jgi:hypothetical protein
MRDLLLYALLVFLLAAGVASAATLFATPSEDDFCFGYAICQ